MKFKTEKPATLLAIDTNAISAAGHTFLPDMSASCTYRLPTCPARMCVRQLRWQGVRLPA